MNNRALVSRLSAALLWVGAIVLMPACGDPLSPASSPLAPSAGSPARATLDGYDDPYGPPPAPPAPVVEPVAPVPAPPVPAAPVVINIVGFFGTGAFAPNPIRATIGDTIVWKNDDRNPHRIVLDDGTPVGSVAPGESTAAITLAAPMASFHCTIHPSMAGVIITVDAPPGVSPLPPPPKDDDDDDGYYGGY